MIIVTTDNVHVPSGREFLISWGKSAEDPHKQHTKPEYIKIHQDRKYQVKYEIRWSHVSPTTQPLSVTVYAVKKDYEFTPLHQHVTVCTGKPVNLRKTFPFDFKSGERVCIAVKNMSECDFTLLDCKLAVNAL